MNNIIIYLLSIPFFYFNYKILKHDLKEKIIPNKYLLYLLYIFLILLIFFTLSPNYSVNYISLISTLLFSLIMCFILYYFGIWGAGDAKYLLVLSLFISWIGVIKFIGNIAIIIILYLILYFFYFYFGKCLINYKYGLLLYKNIIKDLKDKFKLYINPSDGDNTNSRYISIKIILNWIILFLFIFISFRLVRLYFVSYILKDNNNETYAFLFQNYYFQIIAILFGIFLIIRILIKKIFIVVYHFIEDKYGIVIKYNKSSLLIPITLLIILIGFIIYEYYYNPYEIIKYLHKIFTLYISLYILFKILKYGYKLTFHTSETIYIEIEKLQKGEIVDKGFLIDSFGEQKCLGTNNSEGILYPNPKKYFNEINNPIDEVTVEKLKLIYKIVNDYHNDNKTENYERVGKVKTLKTFAFAPYIFLGFLLTLIFEDQIYKEINTLLVEQIQQIFNNSRY